jgi:hypothetical protein
MDRGVREPNLAYTAERLLRVSIPQPGHGGANPFAEYWKGANDDERLALIDFFLHDLDEVAGQHFEDGEDDEMHEVVLVAKRLDAMLTEGGSVWRVSFTPFWSLQRAVNETTQSLVALASSPSTDAARKIASAWNACYRHAPDYGRAYADSVLAVEAVALPVVVPKNQTGTLGHVVAHIADTVDRWTVGGLDADKQASGDTLLAMLRSLWHCQERHARQGGTIVDVSQQEAETAVSLAVTLVHWFGSGLVRRAEGPDPSA